MNKQEIREKIWNKIEESGIARFPFPPHNRIPNFSGAKKAAQKITGIDVWKKANNIKVNPDSPQKYIRRYALKEGKNVYMAVPRLKEEKCFIYLDPDRIDDYKYASTIKGSTDIGENVHPEEIEDIDFIVTGSVAVTKKGKRLGKGSGYSDLEFGILLEYGIIDKYTPVSTTVHNIQVIDECFDISKFDVSLDIISTQNNLIYTDRKHEKPIGIYWDEISKKQLDEIPILKHIKQ